MLKTLFHICIIFIHLAYTQGQSVYNKQSPNLSRIDQTFVYHTNGDLWVGWDSYGNTGDQTCSAIIPGWVYPGGSGLNYNCRAGYWIIANVGGTLYEGTTGQYDVTEGTVPGATSGGWAGSDGDYNKEPWVTTTTWSIPNASLNVVATRRSWSFQGTGYNYYKIDDYDFNDFIIDEIQVINNGSTTVDEIVLGSKADHDVTWNVPYPDWDYAFWTDDIIDYDEETFLSMQLDGDDQGSANNDFGIDDPARQYRGVRVGQAPLSIAGINYSSLSQSDVNHMWWTGDVDPQTVASRYAMATRVSSTGDNKDLNPSPMDMRYLQSYNGGSLAPGDTVRFLMAVVAGSGLENVKQAVFNARKAYDWDWNLPKPPAAPQMTSDGVEALSDGSVKVSWSYTDDQLSAIDPDKGVADFAGFRIYRSIGDSVNAADLFSEEGIIIESDADINESTPYYPNQSGPFSLVADIPASDISNYYDSSSDLYQWTDENTVHFRKHWYFVSSYDEPGVDAVHGSVPSVESYYTMCYPMVEAPDGGGGLIPGINMNAVIPYSEEFTVYSGDTDNNGVVNAYDVLPIGVYFHNVGIAHNSISYVWEPRTVFHWENYLATFADANGDGEIDEKDVIGIGVNWGNTHDDGSAMFTINLNDTLLINEYRETFIQIYNSLAGESHSTIAMRSLLSNILNIEIPLDFSLKQNYPNPFNSGTNISFSIPEPTEVSLVIYNLLGQVISRPMENMLYQAGSHDFKIVGTDLTSGIYFYQIQTRTYQSTKKMVLLK